MILAVRFELVAQLPVVLARAHDVRFRVTTPPQAADHGARVATYPTRVPAAVPDGRLQPDDARPDDVHARRPHQAVLVQPHLVRVFASLDHAVEHVRGWRRNGGR